MANYTMACSDDPRYSVLRRKVASTIFDTVIYKLHRAKPFVKRYKREYSPEKAYKPRCKPYWNRHITAFEIRRKNILAMYSNEGHRCALFGYYRCQLFGADVAISRHKKGRKIGAQLINDIDEFMPKDTMQYLYCDTKWKNMICGYHTGVYIMIMSGRLSLCSLLDISGLPFYLYANALERDKCIYRCDQRFGRASGPTIYNCKGISQKGKRLLRENFDLEDRHRFRFD